MSENDEIRILAPRSAKPRFDRLAAAVQSVSESRITRREALSAAGIAMLAAACGGSSKKKASSGTPSSTKVESELNIFNWSQYDDPSTYTSFRKQHAGLQLHETYYDSNDVLLAKINSGATGYDIVVPTQNAVKQLIDENKLLELDKSLLPNYKNLDAAWQNPPFDPGGKHSVVKDWGVTLFFYRNDIVTEKPKTMKEFYELLPKYGKKGRTNLMDGAEEVVPLALMALGVDPNTTSDSDYKQALTFLKGIRSGVTTITSFGYIDDASAGKIVIGQGWSGDVVRVQHARAKQNDITIVLPDETTERWADNWAILKNAPHPNAAHAWINHILDPAVALKEMAYHNYVIPVPSALAKVPAFQRDSPYFNIDQKVLDRYKFIYNVSPAVVNQRTQVYNAFKAA